MKLHEIIQEQTIEEGPLLNKIGTGVGNVVGGIGKAAGAVAGGIAGLGSAFKKGFQAGKTTVAGAGDAAADTDNAAPGAANAAASAPTAAAADNKTPTSTASTGTAATATPTTPPKSNSKFGRLSQAAAGQDPDAPEQPQAPTAADAAKTQTAAAAGQTTTAAQPTAADNTAKTQAADTAEKPQAQQSAEQPAANDSDFQKIQQNVSKFAPEQQKELLAALMTDPAVKEKLAAAEKSQTATVAQPETPAVAQTDATAKPARQRDAKGRFIGKNAPRTEPTALSQAQLDAEREAKMGPTSDSIIRTKPSITENSLSHVDKMVAMNRGFQRGLANPFAGPGGDDVDDTAPSTSTTIVDKTGTMPVDLINKVNQLESAEKRQLFKFLKARQ